MGHPIINKGERGITLKDIKVSTYKKLIALAETVHAKMLAAVATFATPAPTLANLATQTTTLKAATQPMGLKRNRSSKAETLNAQKAANDLRIMLQQLMTYAVNTVYDLFPEDPYSFNATLATAGFSIKNKRRPKHITQVRFVTQSNTKAFPAAMMRINWRRGTGLLKGAQIAGYLIKQVTSVRTIRTHGYQDVLYSAFAPADPTGLVPATTYEFALRVDGGAPQVVSFLGSGAPTMDDVVTKINSQITGAVCLPLDASNTHFRIQSNTEGVTSSIEISGTIAQYLFSNITGYITEVVPVNGTDITIAAANRVIGSTTKTNFILNPHMGPMETITGQIVPFNSFGEGNPINFTAQYII